MPSESHLPPSRRARTTTRSTTTRRVVAAAAVAATALGLPFLATAGAGAAPRVPAPTVVRGTTPSWAVPAHVVGSVRAAGVLSLSVRLRVDTAAVERYATAVSTPGSAARGEFLTPRAWATRFGAKPAEVAAVVAFLRAHGFTQVAVNASRTAVAARATVGQAQTAFGVTVREYSVGGQTLRAPDRDVRVPAALAGTVTAVLGLSQHPASPASVRVDHPSRTAGTAAAAPAALVPAPCSSWYGQYEVTGLPAAFGVTTLPTAICDGYVPKQIQSAYGLSATIAQGTTGKGVKVAILDAYELPTMAADLARYSTAYGLPALESGQYTEDVPAAYANQAACGGIDGWNGEEALDVESVHTTAPGADIVYVAGSDCITGLSDAFDRLLAGDGRAPLASIATNSYGYGGEGVAPADQQAETLQFLQAAVEGVTVLFSSGDDGDEAAGNDGVAQPSEEAVNPWVTAVGGTSIGIGATGGRLFETGWETSRTALTTDTDGTPVWALPLPGASLYGATGGTSAVYPEPSYQKGVVPDALTYARGNGVAGRVVPDIAAIGDPYTGFREGYSSLDPTTGVRTYVEYGIGGTSVSSPMTAGIIALAQQSSPRTFGFINPVLYGLAATRALHDIQAPRPAETPSEQAVVFDSASRQETDLVGLDKASTLLTTYGYDDVTGLGTPNGRSFVKALAATLR